MILGVLYDMFLQRLPWLLLFLELQVIYSKNPINQLSFFVGGHVPLFQYFLQVLADFMDG